MLIEQLHRPELGGFENKILSYGGAAEKIKNSKDKGLKVILAQGVFDIVHIGHLEYLRKAKSYGDLLFVGVENDLCVRLNKGDSRPFNSLETRLEFLSQLQSVDFVFGFTDTPLYSNPTSRSTFIQRYKDLYPNAIAVTTNFDSSIEFKREQAENAGVDLLSINIDGTKNNSTTHLLEKIGFE